MAKQVSGEGRRRWGQSSGQNEHKSASAVSAVLLQPRGTVVVIDLQTQTGERGGGRKTTVYFYTLQMVNRMN
jgi:hypothetical protein